MRDRAEVERKLAELVSLRASLIDARDRMLPQWQNPGIPEAAARFDARIAKVDRVIEFAQWVLGQLPDYDVDKSI